VTATIIVAVVAIAGYFFQWWQAKGQRDHDMRARRGDRHYEGRKETYLDLLRWSLVALERVFLTEPMVTYADMPEPPDPPSQDQWRDLRARVDALGSKEVGDAADTLTTKSREFFSAVTGYRIARDSADPSSDLEATTTRMLEKREAVTHAYEDLRRLVRDELASL
jgi:hypothetical protein